MLPLNHLLQMLSVVIMRDRFHLSFLGKPLVIVVVNPDRPVARYLFYLSGVRERLFKQKQNLPLTACSGTTAKVAISV